MTNYQKALARAAEKKLTILVGAFAHQLTLAELRGPVADELVERCKAEPSRVVVQLDNLLDFGDADRFAVLDFAAVLAGCRYGANGTEHVDLLEGVLATFSAGMDVPAQRTAQVAALEVVALKYFNVREVACEAIKCRMQKLGIKGIRTLSLMKEAKAIHERLVAHHAETRTSTTVKAILPDASVSDRMIVRQKWEIFKNEIRKRGAEGPSIKAAVVITGLSRDVQRGCELVTIAWKRGERWQQATVERKIIANKTKIIDLADKGLPVHSGNASVLAEFFHDFLVENESHLTLTASSGRMGWQGKDGADGFLWGRTHIAIPAKEDTVTTRDAVQFRGADEGDDQLAAGFHSSGTQEGWLNAIGAISDYPRVRLALYSSFVPPMLPIFGSENFVIDFSGATSQGKTTALKVVASPWGKPDRGGSGGTVLFDWNATATWRERGSSTMNHLPFICDDTQTSRDPLEIAQTVYSFTGGQSRGRGTIAGIARQTEFQSVLISSGERPLISFGEHGGVRARVLTLWGSPFGATDDETGRRVQELNRALSVSYGFAGPTFIEFLAANKKQWGRYRKLHSDWTAIYASMAGDNPVAGRMAAHFAAITVTSIRVHKALALPWEWVDPIEPLYRELTSELAEADRAAAALRHVMSWAVSHQNNFFRKGLTDIDQPHSGWAGRWERARGDSTCANDRWDGVGFLPAVLNSVLKEGNFEADAIIRNWNDRGWLRVNGARHQYRTRLAGEPTWVFAVTREAIDEVGGSDDNL